MPDTQTLAPAGLDSSAFGNSRAAARPDVRLNLATPALGSPRLDLTSAVRPIAARGFAAGVPGTPRVANRTPQLFVAGIASERIGQAVIGDARRFPVQLKLLREKYQPGSGAVLNLGGADLVFASGWRSSTFGKPTVKNPLTVRPAGLESLVFGLTTRIGDTARKGNLAALTLAKLPTGRRLDLLPGTMFPIPVVGIGASALGAATIVNARRSVFAAGWDSARVGLRAAVVPRFVRQDLNQPQNTVSGASAPLDLGDAGMTKVLQLSGIDSTRYGTAAFFVFQHIDPRGAASSVVGTPSIRLARYFIDVPSIRPYPQTGPGGQQEVPPPTVEFRTKIVMPAGIARTLVFGRAIVTQYVQYIDVAGQGIDSLAMGDTSPGRSKSYIEPPFLIAGPTFGSTNIGFITKLNVLGIEAPGFGTPHVDINLQRVYVNGWDSEVIGDITARNAREFVKPLGWKSSTVNFPRVENKARLIFPFPIDNKQVFPNFAPTVLNKARVVEAISWQSSRFSTIGTRIYNNARPITPAGIASQQFGADTFIARNERFIRPQSWVEFHSSRYHAVLNGAATLAPAGIRSAEMFGTPALKNLNRTVKHIFPYAGEAFGTAFIAYAIRTLAVQPYLDPLIGKPEVRLNPYPITPAGFDTFTPGRADLQIHRTIVAPKPVNVFTRERVGEPIVVNRNRTLGVAPSDQSLYGLARVENRIKYLPAGGDVMTLFGRAEIGRRTKIIFPNGLASPAISQSHRIRNLIPDAPASRTVQPIGFENTLMGVPALLDRGIYPQGFVVGFFGKPTVRDNVIRVLKGIFQLDQFGYPELTTRQRITVPPWVAPDSDGRWGKPRMSPYTIYAPSADAASEQYKANNPGLGAEIDEGVAPNGYPWKGFGGAVVSLANRSIELRGERFTEYGYPTVELRTRYIRPNGLKAARYGIPLIPFVPQFLNLDQEHEGIGDSLEFGATAVAPPADPRRRARAVGTDMSIFGTTRVENFRRMVSPVGIDSVVWGLPEIGPPRRLLPPGEVLTIWGQASVTHRVRTLLPEGFDSSSVAIDDDLDYFALRTRVKRQINPVAS